MNKDKFITLKCNESFTDSQARSGKGVIIEYNNLMKQHSEHFYCSKNSDGIYVLVNHAAWCQLKGRKHNGAKIHIESNDTSAQKLLLTMIDGSIREFNYKLKKAIELGVQLDVDTTEDGGFVRFSVEDLPQIVEAFEIKKRQIISESKRELGRQLHHTNLTQGVNNE